MTYIPPSGIYFRIYCPSTQHVLFSRHKDEDKPTFGSSGLSDVNEPAPGPECDQWFYLIPGSGDFKNKYLIKSRLTGKYLYSLPPSLDKTRVGHSNDAAWQTDYTHFKLVPGEGQWRKHFRLVVDTQDQGWAICSGTPDDSDAMTNNAANEVFDSQYFRFLYEDLDVQKVDFNLGDARISSESLTTLDTKKLVNETSVDQTALFCLKGWHDHTSTFTYNSGKEIAKGTKFSAAIPFVNDDRSVLLGSDKNIERSLGTEESLSHSYDAQLNVRASPGTTVVGTLIVTKGDLEVPFTATLASKTGVETTSEGMWRGTLSWGSQYILTEC